MINSFCYSQKGLIYYDYIDAKGVGNAKGQASNSYMAFNKEMSYYVTAKDSLERDDVKNNQTVIEDGENGGGSIYNGMKVSEQGDQVVYHIKKKTMWSNILYVKQFYVKEVAPTINWKISKETKKIGKFNCKKATANFRGRNYIAWFTTEIAVPFGPWKLHGLPGLILEAYDANKEVSWSFKSVQFPSKIKVNVKYMSIPSNLKFMTYSEFKNAQQEVIEKQNEEQKIMGKQYPEITFITPKLNLLFIECE